MPLSPETIEHLAEQLDEAELRVRGVPQVTALHPDLDTRDAYAIQDAIRRRKAARGVGLAGLKMGLTANATWDQYGIREPIHGFLPGDGAVPDGGEIALDQLFGPRVEAELAFVLKAPLHGPDCTLEQALAAVAVVMPALEVVDSRYVDFRFDVNSLIADNASAARFVLGAAPRPAEGLDLPGLGMTLVKNGEVVATATASALLGHPANSLAALANLLHRQGRHVPAAVPILAGSATAAVEVRRGDTLALDCEHLGTVSVRFV